MYFLFQDTPEIINSYQVNCKNMYLIPSQSALPKADKVMTITAYPIRLCKLIISFEIVKLKV